jgi:hypothetical protein
MMSRAVVLELNTEYPAQGEDELADKLVRLLRGTVEQRFLQGLTYRGVNTKSHAAVRAEVTVAGDLPDSLRIGLFRETRSYPAWIRFSSTLSDPLPDNDRDLRGMSLKLMDVNGEKLLESDRYGSTHDLIFITPDTFFTSTPEDFYSFAKAGGMNAKKSLGDLVQLSLFMLTHPAVPVCILKSQKRIGSLLEVPWYSATPYLFGDRAAKLSLWPWLTARTPVPSKPANNYLREDLIRKLHEIEAGFDLRVQFQLDPYKQPIEDALAPWREEDSPWHKVATVVLPKQSIDAPEQMLFGENLSMNPWRCIAEHRPLGGINRVRKKIYYEGSKFRHERNAVPVTEPVPGEDVPSVRQRPRELSRS